MSYRGASRTRRPRRTLLVLAAVVAAAPAAWGQATPAVRGDSSGAARALMADALVHRAQQSGRDTGLPTTLAAREALVLLQEANALAPGNPDTLRMLVEAARVAADADVLRNALKELLGVDGQDLVAQVQFLDAVARAKPVEQQIGVYQSALNSERLDPQVRSAAATRVGRLLLQRGEAAAALAMFNKAVELNDVNVDALQELCRAAVAQGAAPPEQIRLFSQLLEANPFQPDALVTAARVLAASNAHERAGEWLSAALEQFERAGQRTSPDLLEELVVDLACADAVAEAGKGASELLNLPEAPLDVLLLGYTVRTPGMTAPVPQDQSMTPTVRARADELAKAAMAEGVKNPQALSDALWIELFYLAKPGDGVDAQLEHLRDLVGAEDPLYLRLFGWRLLRQDKLNAAEKVLTPLAARDAYAELGLARIAEARNDNAGAAKHLQAIWNNYPRGLLAVHITAEARKINVPLQATAQQRAVSALADRYPRHLLLAHRSPEQLVEVTSRAEQPAYALGQPIYATVTFNNKTDRALSVGSVGAVKVNMAIGGSLRGLEATPLGVFGASDAPRLYRVDRRAAFSLRVRIDQGQLWELMYYNPTRLISANAFLLTAPLENGNSVKLGLGGVRVPSAAQFDRAGLSLDGIDGIGKLASDLPRQPVEQQMLGAAVLENVLTSLPTDKQLADAEDAARVVFQEWQHRKAAAEAAAAAAAAAATQPSTAPASDTDAPPPVLPPTPPTPPQLQPPPNLVDPDKIAAQRTTLRDLREQVVHTLVERLDRGDPLVAAWMLQFRPTEELPEALAASLDQQAKAPSPVVRMSYYYYCATAASNDRAKRTAASAALSALAAQDSDPDAKQWAMLLAEQLKLAPVVAPTTAQATSSSAPATQPTTQPAATQGVTPAIVPAP